MPILKQVADELTGVKAAAAAAQGLDKAAIPQEVLEGTKASIRAKLDATIGLKKLGAQKTEESVESTAPPTKLDPGVYQDDAGKYFVVREDGIQELDNTPLADNATVFRGAQSIERERPRQYLSATRFDNDRRFDEVDKSDTFNAFQQAEYLAHLGYSNREIFEQTGMFVGREGKIRSPLTGRILPDVFLQVMRSPEDIHGKVSITHDIFRDAQKNKIQLKLQDMIDWPELYKAYPELAHVKVEEVPLLDVFNMSAGYDPVENIMYLKPYASDRDGLTKSIVHEVQHAIQKIEGFSPGSTSEAELGPIDKSLLDGNAEKITKVAEEASDFLRTVKDKMTLDLADFGDRWNSLPGGDRNFTSFYKSGRALDELALAVRKYLGNLESKSNLTEQEASNIPIFRAALDRLDEYNADPRVKFANETIALRRKMKEMATDRYKAVSGEQEAYETAGLIGKTPDQVRQEIGENLLDKVTFGPKIEAASKDGISEQRADEPRKTVRIQKILKAHVDSRDPPISSGIRSSLSELRDIINSTDPDVIRQLDQAAAFSGVNSAEFKKSLNNLYNWYAYIAGDGPAVNPRELITDYELDWWAKKIESRDPALSPIINQLSYIKSGMEDTHNLQWYQMRAVNALDSIQIGGFRSRHLNDSLTKLYGQDRATIYPLARSKKVEDAIVDALIQNERILYVLEENYPEYLKVVQDFTATPFGTEFKFLEKLLEERKKMATADIQTATKGVDNKSLSKPLEIKFDEVLSDVGHPYSMNVKFAEAIRRYVGWIGTDETDGHLAQLNDLTVTRLADIVVDPTLVNNRSFNIVRDRIIDQNPDWPEIGRALQMFTIMIHGHSWERKALLNDINKLRGKAYETVDSMLTAPDDIYTPVKASDEFGVSSFIDAFQAEERFSKTYLISKYIVDNDEAAIMDMFNQANVLRPPAGYSKKDLIKYALSGQGQSSRALRKEILKSMPPEEAYKMAPWYPYVEKFNKARYNSPAWTRARAQGWTTEVMFHTGPKGENEKGFTEFKDKLLGNNTGARSAKMGHFVTNSPMTSQGYSTLDDSLVYPVLLKYNNPKVVNYLGKTWRDLGDGVLSDDIRKAFKSGHDAVIIELFDDIPSTSDIARHIIVKSGSQIRSAFDAFSPQAANSKRLDASKNFAPKELLGIPLATLMAGGAASDADAMTVSEEKAKKANVPNVLTGARGGRVEISDDKAELMLKEKDRDTLLAKDLMAIDGKRIGEILKHDELFSMYPELKSIKFSFDRAGDGTRMTTPSMDSSKWEIVISLPDVQEAGLDYPNVDFSMKEWIQSSIIHELQHAIQKIDDSIPADERAPTFSDPRKSPGFHKRSEVEARAAELRMKMPLSERKKRQL